MLTMGGAEHGSSPSACRVLGHGAKVALGSCPSRLAAWVEGDRSLFKFVSDMRILETLQQNRVICRDGGSPGLCRMVVIWVLDGRSVSG